MPRRWSFSHDRRVIELAKAGMSLEEASQVLNRTPEGIWKSSVRLGVSFKSAAKPNSRRKNKKP